MNKILKLENQTGMWWVIQYIIVCWGEIGNMILCKWVYLSELSIAIKWGLLISIKYLLAVFFRYIWRLMSVGLSVGWSLNRLDGQAMFHNFLKGLKYQIHPPIGALVVCRLEILLTYFILANTECGGLYLVYFGDSGRGEYLTFSFNTFSATEEILKRYRHNA